MHYEFARTLGLHYGPAFRAVAAAWYRREGVLGSIATPAEITADAATALLHPSYLDGAFQLLADLALREQRDNPARRADAPAFLPVRIARLELFQRARASHGRACVPGRSRVTAAGAPCAPISPSTTRSMRRSPSLAGVRFRAVAIQAGAAHRSRWIATRAVPMPRRDPFRAVALPAIADLARHCAARLHTPERLARAAALLAGVRAAARCPVRVVRRPRDCANSPATNPSSRKR